MSGIRVRVLAHRNRGLFLRPFVRDTSTRCRFPPAVTLRASVLGLPVGELTIANGDHFGRVLALSVAWPWPVRPVALRLMREAAALGPQAQWNQLAWWLDAGDAKTRALATSLGFQPVSPRADEVLFERLIGDVHG
jgi:hypothetical protein